MCVCAQMPQPTHRAKGTTCSQAWQRLTQYPRSWKFILNFRIMLFTSWSSHGLLESSCLYPEEFTLNLRIVGLFRVVQWLQPQGEVSCAFFCHALHYKRLSMLVNNHFSLFVEVLVMTPVAVTTEGRRGKCAAEPVWQLLRRMEISLPQDASTLLLGLYTKDA